MHSAVGIPCLQAGEDVNESSSVPRRARQYSGVLLSGVALIAAIIAGRPSEGYAEQPSPVPASFSQGGLQRVGDYIRNEIATGKIPGAILLIQQHGKPVYFENFGVRDVVTRLPMTADTIFRLYSMSKPITSVAAMMLVEEGRLSLGVKNTQDDCAGVETVGFQERNKKAPWTFQPRTPRQPSPRTAKPRVG